MKKTRFIALAVAVALMLMGAGYALWTDTINFESTINTGNFDMKVIAASTRTGDDQLRNEVHDWHSFDWTHKGGLEFNEDSVTVVFDDLYPGGAVQLDTTVKNEGTIPAKLKSIKVEFVEGNRKLFNLLRAQTSWKADINGDGEQDAWEHVDQWRTWDPLQEAMNKLVQSTIDRNLVIEPGGWFALGDGTEDGCIKFRLDSSAGNDLQNEFCTFRLVFEWEQWADNPNNNPYDAAKDGSKPGYGGDGDIQDLKDRGIIK